MKKDLFISYAWTSLEHREWVRLLASQIRLLGYDVMIDEAVDYGSSLSGFMQKATAADHVLLILDANYVHRADTMPESGVATETRWISSVFSQKPVTWLSVVFVRNPEHNVPTWLVHHKPKGFDFNSDPSTNTFPGTEQIDDLWRWIEGLPDSKANAIPLAEMRRRTARVEDIDARRDPALYADPSLKGRVTFRHRDNRDFKMGHGEYEFKVQFSACSIDSVYVYSDYGLKAVGLITTPNYDPLIVNSFLTPGRLVSPRVGQSVVLLNSHGALCVLKIEEVQREINATDYVPEHVTFAYEVMNPE
jgi:hypothetical protein